MGKKQKVKLVPQSALDKLTETAGQEVKNLATGILGRDTIIAKQEELLEMLVDRKNDGITVCGRRTDGTVTVFSVKDERAQILNLSRGTVQDLIDALVDAVDLGNPVIVFGDADLAVPE